MKRWKNNSFSRSSPDPYNEQDDRNKVTVHIRYMKRYVWMQQC